MIRLSAWMSFSAYVVALVLLWTTPRGRGRDRQIAWIWLAGAVLMVVHTLVAFHFRHAWSHALAWQDTARQTQALVGLNWGGGLWLNYFAATLWVLDACWWLTWPKVRERRSRWVALATEGFLGFMWFNGLVVFGSIPARWLGIAGFAALAWIWWRTSWKASSRSDA